MPISSIDEALEDIRQGRMVILVNEERRRQRRVFLRAGRESDNADSINQMLHHGSGVIYLALTEERIRELGILLIPHESSSFSGHLFGAAFSARLEGVPAVSAQGRAHTIQVAVADQAKHADLIVPGHVQPIQARTGGVLARSGRAEASVDLARLCGFNPAGVICHILNDDGAVALLPDLEQLAERLGIKIVAVTSLIAYRLRNESLVKRAAEEIFPTIHGGMYKAIVYRNEVDGFRAYGAG